MSNRHRIAACFLLLPLAACSFQDVDDGTVKTSTASSTATSGGSGGGALTGASTTASGSGGAVSGSTSTGGSETSKTPSSIVCGGQPCDLPANDCCGSTCKPAGTCPTGDTGSNPQTNYNLSCDDWADCGLGEMCCVGTIADPFSVSCAATCELVESCIPNGECKTKDTTCVEDATSPTGARCVPLGATVPSCAGSACDAKTPVCCWDSSSSSEVCAATTGECFPSQTIACDGPGSCAEPYPVCCALFGGSACQAVCGGKEATVCATEKDCPMQGGVVAKACAADPLLHVSVCQY